MVHRLRKTPSHAHVIACPEGQWEFPRARTRARALRACEVHRLKKTPSRAHASACPVCHPPPILLSDDLKLQILILVTESRTPNLSFVRLSQILSEVDSELNLVIGIPRKQFHLILDVTGVTGPKLDELDQIEMVTSVRSRDRSKDRCDPSRAANSK